MQLKTFSNEKRSRLEKQINDWITKKKITSKNLPFEPKFFWNSYKKKWYYWILYEAIE